MLTMQLLDGTTYTLTDSGAVVDRTDGPHGWDYSGKWVITGFARRWHSHAVVSLADAVAGADTGYGYVCDLDHGTPRRWGGSSGRRLASITRS